MFNSSTHRKIAMYRAVVDETDGEGHGSHCGGSIAGSYENGTSFSAINRCVTALHLPCLLEPAQYLYVDTLM